MALALSVKSKCKMARFLLKDECAEMWCFINLDVFTAGSNTLTVIANADTHKLACMQIHKHTHIHTPEPPAHTPYTGDWVPE